MDPGGGGGGGGGGGDPESRTGGPDPPVKSQVAIAFLKNSAKVPL